MDYIFNLFYQLDVYLFQLINQNFSNQVFDLIFPNITDLHKNKFFTVALMTVLFFLFRQKYSKKNSIYALLILILSLAFSDGTGNLLFKQTFQRPRPAENSDTNAIVRSPFGGYSMISNHAANTFNIAFYVSTIYPPSKIYFYTFASLVALSRVYNGVHYPFDIIIGAFYGVLCSWIFTRFFKKLLLKQNESKK